MEIKTTHCLAACERCGGNLTTVLMSAVVAIATISISASAADRSFIWREGVGTSVASAAEWFDSENWKGGAAAQTTSDYAYLTNKTSGRLFIRADRALTIGRLDARGGLSASSLDIVDAKNLTTNDRYQVHFISDYPFAIAESSPGVSYVRIYADIVLPDSDGYHNSILMCGDINNAAPLTFNTGFTHHMDLYANATGEVRVNPGTTNSFKQSWGDAVWYAPHGSSADVVGQWSQTEGSRYLFRTGAAHVLCAGTTVSGDGIPSGAFLKRIFDDGTIEISAPAGETIAENSITFGAFSPKVSQFVNTYDATASSDVGDSYAQKYRDEDEFTMEIGKMTLPANKGRRFATKTWCRPARWLLHDATGVLGKIYMNDCHLEFASKVDGDASAVGLPNTYVVQEKAGHKSRLAVGVGLSGSIQCISNLVGTVVKDGPGALRTSLAPNSSRNTGVLVVEQGVLELTGDTEHYVKTLAISNGATLKISGAALRVDGLEVASGARIDGGAVLVPSLAACSAARAAGLLCTNGGNLSCIGTDGPVMWEPAATNVTGNPAL